MRYIAYIRKEAGSDYGIEFLDLPGCVSAGKSPEEAHAMGLEAAKAYVEYPIEDGKSIPRASSSKDFKIDDDREDTVVCFVELSGSSFETLRRK